MTAQDLAAARQRVTQRQRDLDAATTALKVVEHDEYLQALKLIGNAIGELPDELGGGDARLATNAVNAVRVVLAGVGL